jgi:hypothetical protein
MHLHYIRQRDNLNTMPDIFKTLQAPNNSYSIVVGNKEEYRLGGPYAGPIYLNEKQETLFLIYSLCYGDIFFSEDCSTIYFLTLNFKPTLHCKVASFNIPAKKLIVFEKNVESASIKSVEKSNINLILKSAYTTIADKLVLFNTLNEKTISLKK